MEPTYKLEELARAADVSPRTVRYYVQRGLLPAPAFRGKDTVYTAEHLARLNAIKKAQARFMPLDAIQAEFERRGSADIHFPVTPDPPPPSLPFPPPPPLP